MQTDGRTQTYGKRETTLIGYPPAAPALQPEAPSDLQKSLAPAGAAISPGFTAVTAPYAAGETSLAAAGEEPVTRVVAYQASEPVADEVANPAANLASALAPEPATSSAADGAGTFLAPANVLAASGPLEPRVLERVEAGTKGERRNPRSRRLPINRGRHLSRAFFEEGDKQEQTGWENSPLADEPFGASSTNLGFNSFDRVPRKRGPVIAAAVGIGAVAAILGGWALSSSSSARDAKPTTNVWSALRVPGAGWQPQPPITTTTPRAAAPAPAAIAAPEPVSPPAPTRAVTVAAPPPAPPAAVTTTPVSAPRPAPVVAAAKPIPAPKATAPAAFAPTRDVAKAPAGARPAAVRVSTASPTARRHAVAARRVPPRPVARTPVPARARAKSPPAPVAEAAEGAEAPAPTEPALPAASAAPEPAAVHEAPAAEPESAPGDAQ